MAAGTQRTTAYIAGLSDTQTFSPTLVGEFRFGLARSLDPVDAAQRRL